MSFTPSIKVCAETYRQPRNTLIYHKKLPVTVGRTIQTHGPYPSLPADRIGRLAVDQDIRGHMLLARSVPDLVAKLWLIAVSITVTLLVAVSRVYLGVHWPTDVLAGLAVGATWASLCWLVELSLQKRGKVEPTEDR